MPEIQMGMGESRFAVISRAEFYSMRSQKVVEESFGGSLPAFIAAFTSTQPLTGEERAEILRMIENAKED